MEKLGTLGVVAHKVFLSFEMDLWKSAYNKPALVILLRYVCLLAIKGVAVEKRTNGIQFLIPKQDA